MKVVIPGGTGQVGTVLARTLHQDGHEVVALGRSPAHAPWRVAPWDPERIGDWARWMDGADAVVNLAGRSVNCRYGADNRREILQSRVGSTAMVGQAIARARRPPQAWLQASTATIYAHRYDAPNDEATGIIGGSEADAPDRWRFSVEVATAWERALDDAIVPGTRKVAMRAAVILSPDRGGIFDTLLTLVRRGLGGTSGDGRQYVSLIHDQDFVRAVYWLLERPDLSGPVNLAAPDALPNRDFMAALRRAWGIAVGVTREPLDARARRLRHANRNRAGPEEPAGAGRSPPRRRVRLQILRLAGRRPGSLHPLESAATADQVIQPRAS